MRRKDGIAKGSRGPKPLMTSADTAKVKEASGEYKDRKGGLTGRHKKRGERLHLQMFFRIASARYKRIRKLPRRSLLSSNTISCKNL
ncbi:MAG: hypothetical protein HDR88_01705 [Bacteroides sp.]|nr:hypothetical protein [Bacteroides sp.]